MLHDALVLGVSGLCLWALISPRLPTGVLGSLGLGTMAGAALWSIDYFAKQEAVADMLLAGIGLLGLHALLRVLRRRSSHMRRLSDWQPTRWADTAPPQEIHESQQVHIVGGKR